MKPIPRPPALYDTECFPNYWLLKFRPIGGATRAYRLREDECFSPEQSREIVALFDKYCAISFNGRGYDVWMIAAACSGSTPADLKRINDTIIVERVKPWEIADIPRWEPADHIDVMEVSPGAGSLKQYAGRIHCRTMRDLPYGPDEVLTLEQIEHVEAYCENDLDVLGALYAECAPLLQMREALSERYGLDLRSKSDAQVAEAVLRRRCEQASGKRIYRPDWPIGQSFKYTPPSFVSFRTPELQRLLDVVVGATFYAADSGAIEIPEQLEKIVIALGRSTYKVGIGGLHSQEKSITFRSDESVQLRAPDVASYYPSLILNSGEFPPALGPDFRTEYASIKAERLAAKDMQGRLKREGDTSSDAYAEAKATNEGGKLMINGTFGKTGSSYSVLYAPSMFLQTTMTGQLSLLMLIEWHELWGINVVSANTDGLVIACPRALLGVSDYLIDEWQRRTGLEMENADWSALYARDVNNYFAVTSDGEVKRKGEYSAAGLTEKKNPDCEICSDAVAAYLARAEPIESHIRASTDIRKFVTMQRVTGGGVKMWGDGPRKTDKVRDMVPRLEAHGWTKQGRGWVPMVGEPPRPAAEAYASTFSQQRPEYLGKVVRWYYGTNSPGPIVYAARNAVVGLSYGAQPCMTLPDKLPDDIDFDWYVSKAISILDDIGCQPPVEKSIRVDGFVTNGKHGLS